MPNTTSSETTPKTKTATVHRGNGRFKSAKASKKARGQGRRRGRASAAQDGNSYGRTAANLASRGRSALGEAYSWAGDHLPSDMGSVRQMANERPLVLGAIGLGLGMLLGVMLPATRRAASSMMPGHGRGRQRRSRG